MRPTLRGKTKCNKKKLFVLFPLFQSFIVPASFSWCSDIFWSKFSFLRHYLFPVLSFQDYWGNSMPFQHSNETKRLKTSITHSIARKFLLHLRPKERMRNHRMCYSQSQGFKLSTLFLSVFRFIYFCL